MHSYCRFRALSWLFGKDRMNINYTIYGLRMWKCSQITGKGSSSFLVCHSSALRRDFTSVISVPVVKETGDDNLGSYFPPCRISFIAQQTTHAFYRRISNYDLLWEPFVFTFTHFRRICRIVANISVNYSLFLIWGDESMKICVAANEFSNQRKEKCIRLLKLFYVLK